MTERALPNRRLLTRQKVKIGGHNIYFDVGFYDEEKTEIGEVWIVVEQTGAEMRALMDDGARLSSKLIQYGCSVEEVALGWLGVKGRPCGPVQGDARIKNATSIRDYIARHLLITYYQRDDLAHVKEVK